jgi:hypothetical protein
MLLDAEPLSDACVVPLEFEALLDPPLVAEILPTGISAIQAASLSSKSSKDSRAVLPNRKRHFMLFSGFL